MVTFKKFSIPKKGGQLYPQTQRETWTLIHVMHGGAIQLVPRNRIARGWFVVCEGEQDVIPSQFDSAGRTKEIAYQMFIHFYQ